VIAGERMQMAAPEDVRSAVSAVSDFGSSVVEQQRDERRARPSDVGGPAEAEHLPPRLFDGSFQRVTRMGASVDALEVGKHRPDRELAGLGPACMPPHAVADDREDANRRVLVSHAVFVGLLRRIATRIGPERGGETRSSFGRHAASL
jgi:hypothetical protein